MMQTQAARAPSGKLRERAIFSYASGELGANLGWNMFSGFILFYYTNVALLPAAAVGTLLLLTRVLDAFIDPAMGVIVDRTRTRWGRARPWLVGAAIPFAIVAVMSFSIPDWSPDAKLVWAALTFTIAGLLFSTLYVPFGALLPLMTSDPVEKLRIGGLRAMGASLGSIIVYMGMLPLVGWLGGADRQVGFTSAAAVMVALAAATMLATFVFCRERISQVGQAQKLSILRTMRLLAGNPIWRIVSLFALVMMFRLGALVSVTAYYASDVLGRPALTGILLGSLSFSLLLGGWLTRPWLQWLGKRRGNLVALSLAVLASPVLLLVRHYPWAFELIFFVSNVTLGIQSASCFILGADAVDEQELRTGRRDEGLVTSSISFGTKVGMAAGGSLTAYGLALVHYDARHITPAAQDMMTVLFFGAAPALALVQMAVISFLRERVKAS
jgi:GPH family glycoside/pentoside/hexuronide:cation symporter